MAHDVGVVSTKRSHLMKSFVRHRTLALFRLAPKSKHTGFDATPLRRGFGTANGAVLLRGKPSGQNKTPQTHYESPGALSRTALPRVCSITLYCEWSAWGRSR